MNYQKAANYARSFLKADSTPTSSAQIANGLIDVVLGVLRVYISRASATLGVLVSTVGILVTGSQQGLGYGIGAGGAVTQATNSSTGVTLNKVSGQITTVALTTAAGAEEVFTVTNTCVAATDVIVVSTTYAGAGTILVATKAVAAGSFNIVISNLHASAALNAAAVIKAVAS